MSARRPLKISLGSRGSELARTQTAMVVEALRHAWPELEIETHIISTRGDTATAQPVDARAGRKGLFTGEIERALGAGEIDIAVHSAKDLPSEATSGLEVGAVLPRASVQDVLVTRSTTENRNTIGTGSVRRQHQLRWKYPGVEVVDLRGNVPTRLRKLVESNWEAIVLARAGLERLGYDIARGSFEFEGTSLRAKDLSCDDFLPAGGQGIIAIQVRSDDTKTNDLLQNINDTIASLCLQAEREFLRLLQGDCGSPVGVLATIAGSNMTVRAQVFEPSRVEPRTARVEGEAASPMKRARELWEAING